MKKTIYACLISAALAPSAFATEDMRQHSQPGISSTPSSCTNFNGFVAGGVLGIGSGRAKTTLSPTLAGAAFPATNVDLSTNGVNGGILLGYGKSVSASKVHLGLELSYMLDGAEGKLTTPVAVNGIGANLSIKRQDSFNADARLGVIMGNALPYVLLGWANSKIKASNYGVSYISKRKNGLNLGVGIDFKLTKHIVAGLFYKYTTFSKTGQPVYTSTDGATAPTALSNTVLKSSLADNKVQIKLAYQF